MLTPEQKYEFNNVFESLGDSLDITQTQYEAAVKSYKSVGDYLASQSSSLASYKPIIRPQGSFMLGTMIQPVNDKDDLDIDLVCELTGKHSTWTQYDLKQKVGDRLKEHGSYRDMLEKEGRRCWTLRYSDTANYHMDILPSLVCDGYSAVLERAFSDSLSGSGPLEYDNLAIRITDRKESNYMTQPNPDFWLKSNPLGYGRWFFWRASINQRKLIMLLESVKPVPSYNKEKLPLQRVVQILKRHRDIMFNGNEDKPISIIITTLAAKAYQGEDSITEALLNITNRMNLYIEEKLDPNTGKVIKVISNPVNPEENFADKWVEHPQREINFHKWLEAVRNDIYHIMRQQGLHIIGETMKGKFGDRTVNKAFSNMASNVRNQRESGILKMATGTGILGSIGSVAAKPHNFHGKD